MVKLLVSWIAHLKNADHMGIVTQIYDAVKDTDIDNDTYKACVKALKAAVDKEDDAYKKTQKDWAVEDLRVVDKQMDNYMSAIKAIVSGHTLLPDGEKLKQPAVELLYLWKDFDFKTSDSYSGESMKVINMHQEVKKQQAVAEEMGIWNYFNKAKEKAEEIQALLSDRFTDLAQRVLGELKIVRNETDQRVRTLYQLLNALAQVSPTGKLTELLKKLRAIEDYARTYYLRIPLRPAEDWSGMPEPEETAPDNPGNPPLGGD